MDEQILLESIKGGDIRAFNKLFEMHYERLVRMLYLKSYNQVVSEDIVQNIFIEFWTNRGKITINKSLGAYLTTCTRNRYIDYYRKQRNIDSKEKLLQSESLHFKVETPEDQLLTKEKLSLIYSKIEALPFKSRVIFQLSRFDNKSYQEISEELNVSKKTVEYHISNALRLLRKSIFILIF